MSVLQVFAGDSDSTVDGDGVGSGVGDHRNWVGSIPYVSLFFSVFTQQEIGEVKTWIFLQNVLQRVAM